LKKPKNLQLPNVTFNKIEFDPIIDYGIVQFLEIPQYNKLHLMRLRKKQQNLKSVNMLEIGFLLLLRETKENSFMVKILQNVRYANVSIPKMLMKYSLFLFG
jgi:hypothetical protein